MSSIEEYKNGRKKGEIACACVCEREGSGETNCENFVVT